MKNTGYTEKELWDIYDRNEKPTGRFAERGSQGGKDDYHLVVHVWVRTEDGRFLITRRSPNKTFPLKWETTGGAAKAGDNGITAALRELCEETGLSLSPDDAEWIGTYREEGGTFNSFAYVAVFTTDCSLEDIIFQPGETCGAMFCTPEEILKMEKAGSFVKLSEHYPYYERIFNMEKIKEYRVVTLNEIDWNRVPSANVDEYVWGGGYRPETTAQLAYIDGRGLAVKMTCAESNPKAVHYNFYEEVWLDSCMEFFFGFRFLGDYINCEMNSLGVSLVGVGDGRDNRRRIDEITARPVVTAEKKENEWSAEAFFSIEILKAVFGEDLRLEKGSVFYGNFFKVGEETHTPHYGMWNPIVWEHPDFHRPECFGKFIID